MRQDALDGFYGVLVERAAPSFNETGMVDLVHLSHAAALGCSVSCFIEDVAEAADLLAQEGQ